MSDETITQREEHLLSINEVACVTGVPLEQVYRIISSDLLNDAVKGGGPAILSKALVGVKLAYETTEILTLEGHRRLICRLLYHPEADTVREGAVSVDIQPMKIAVQRGLTALENAKKMVVSTPEILSGTPCFKGTRIPVYYIANMIANGDQVPSILKAYPRLDEEQVDAATLYAKAYPLRDRWKKSPTWEKQRPISSSKTTLDALSGPA